MDFSDRSGLQRFLYIDTHPENQRVFVSTYKMIFLSNVDEWFSCKQSDFLYWIIMFCFKIILWQTVNPIMIYENVILYAQCKKQL